MSAECRLPAAEVREPAWGASAGDQFGAGDARRRDSRHHLGLIREGRANARLSKKNEELANEQAKVEARFALDTETPVVMGL